MNEIANLIMGMCGYCRFEKDFRKYLLRQKAPTGLIGNRGYLSYVLIIALFFLSYSYLLDMISFHFVRIRTV